LKLLLEGVVENGTAKNIKGTHYRIAGKTGTAQILEKGRYAKKYITSFVGYFPAHAPKYSAIVLIKNPRGWYQYGSSVAAPVFKEIADNIYARDINLHQPMDIKKFAQVFRRHGCAFNMPARETDTPWTVPFHLPFLTHWAEFPQSKISGKTFLSDIYPRASLQSIYIQS
jgi:membrane peptidoglycan carboxypeptidase